MLEKKSFMKFFVGTFSCMGLYWFNLENIYIGLMFYFWIDRVLGSLVFIIPTYLIFYPEQQDSISAKGYSLGYIGINLLVINWA
jgi:UMF1 family MFS transporter